MHAEFGQRRQAPCPSGFAGPWHAPPPGSFARKRSARGITMEPDGALPSWNGAYSYGEPSGVPRRLSSNLAAPVAQLDRAPDYESGGRRFESFRARHQISRQLQPLLVTPPNRTKLERKRVWSQFGPNTTHLPARLSTAAEMMPIASAVAVSAFLVRVAQLRNSVAGSCPARSATTCVPRSSSSVGPGVVTAGRA
jgi:hypothetical protein